MACQQHPQFIMSNVSDWWTKGTRTTEPPNPPFRKPAHASTEIFRISRAMNQTGRTDIPSPSPSISGSEERPENNLQVPRRLRLLRRAHLLEAAGSVPRHRASAEVSLRQRRARAERRQRRHGRDGAGGSPPPQPEPPHYWPGLPGRVPQLLQGLALLPRHRRPLLRQRHQLPEPVLRAGLQHGHAPHQPVLPLPGALVLPCGVSNLRARGGGVYLQRPLTNEVMWERNGGKTKPKNDWLGAGPRGLSEPLQNSRRVFLVRNIHV